MSSPTVPSSPARLTRIISRTAEETGLSVADLTGIRKRRPLARARFAAVWAMRATGASWPAIGQALGGRCHTTMIHAHARAAELRERDPHFQALTVLLELADWSTDRA